MTTPCNLCGLSCGLMAGPCDEEELVDHGLIGCAVMGELASTPGNGNGALDDCDRYTFSLCEFCLDWLMSRFVVPPTVAAVSLGTCDIEGNPKHYPDRPRTWRPAEQRVREDAWRKTEERFFAEKLRRDGARRA